MPSYWDLLEKNATNNELIEAAITRILDVKIAYLEAEVESHNYFNTVSTWGLLPKSQIDNETIEEAIARLIAVHESDENSHLGVGESLQSHKASEIIDHLAASIVADKIADFAIDFKKLSGNQYMLLTCFENENAWNANDGDTGYSITLTIFKATVATGGTINYWAVLASEPDTVQPVLNFAKNSFLQTTARVDVNTSQLAYISAGDHTNGYGFKISNGTLYSFHNGVAAEVATEITGITVTNYNVYRAVFSADDSKIYFYVNSVLRATHSTDLPAGTTTYVMEYYIKTLTNAVRNMRIRDLLFFCDR